MPYAGAVCAPFVLLAWFTQTAHGGLSQYTGHGIEYLVIYGALAFIGGVFNTFCVAYTCAPLILFLIHTAQSRGETLFDARDVHAVTLFSAHYAAIRCASVLLVRHANVPPGPARLLVLSIAILETFYMIATPSLGRNYVYRVYSSSFALYVLVKMSIFAFLPLLEEGLATHELKQC